MIQTLFSSVLTKSDADISSNDSINKNYQSKYYEKCNECGNIWDGCAQCTCWIISIESNKIIIDLTKSNDIIDLTNEHDCYCSCDFCDGSCNPRYGSCNKCTIELL